MRLVLYKDINPYSQQIEYHALLFIRRRLTTNTGAPLLDVVDMVLDILPTDVCLRCLHQCFSNTLLIRRKLFKPLLEHGPSRWGMVELRHALNTHHLLTQVVVHLGSKCLEMNLSGVPILLIVRAQHVNATAAWPDTPILRLALELPNGT